MRNFRDLALLGAIIALAGCLSACGTPDLTVLSQDPATLSVHQVITAPGYSVTTDVTRVNSVGTAATAGTAGAAVNVPNGAVVNTAPSKPAAGTTLAPATAGQ